VLIYKDKGSPSNKAIPIFRIILKQTCNEFAVNLIDNFGISQIDLAESTRQVVCVWFVQSSSEILIHASGILPVPTTAVSTIIRILC
jgi:hypothetical protein